jgi:uncharacterized protein (DUF305 family)
MSRAVAHGFTVTSLVVACTFGGSACGQDQHHQHRTMTPGKAPVFIASTAKPFAALMGDAMAVMDDGMKRAPMNGVSEHDFVTMMIPHHQGAIDMAKALLLYTRDAELRNVAQGIITEQQNEIKVMQAWLQRYQAAQAKVAPSSITKKE